MPRTVDVRLEPDALFGIYLATVAQREDLEAAAVGEDGAVPAVELVQTASLAKHLNAGAQIEVVGVAQNNLCLHILFQIPDMQ